MTKKYTKRINIYAEQDLYDFLKSRADKGERTLSNYSRALLNRIKQIIENEEEKKQEQK